MSVNTNNTKVRNYQAPDCDAYELVSGTISAASMADAEGFAMGPGGSPSYI